MNEFLRRYEEWGFPQRENIKLEKSLRINTNRTTEEKIIKRLNKQRVKLTKIPFLKDGYHFYAHFPLASSLENLLGHIYIQESSAQIPAELIRLHLKKVNPKILDMCAAPGGKTTQLSQITNNTGTIVATDIRKDRLKKLCYNLERMHVTNCIVHHLDPSNKEETKDLGKFDAILIDAPCSGNFCSERRWFEKRSFGQFKNRQSIQLSLLKNAKNLLKKDGIIIYSTCTLEKEENEEVVEEAIKMGFKVLPPKLKVGSPGLTSLTKNCIRIWPTQHKEPGFFVAILKLN